MYVTFFFQDKWCIKQYITSVNFEKKNSTPVTLRGQEGRKPCSIYLTERVLHLEAGS